ncbi:TonB-dependent receptor [Pleomorphovibrio marinus]|uniref:TonB-dependent receptor n=1 Tax=Pleomorphovibrio marinus TaxID=2164132 RepID=UPI001E5AD99A|nr:TonB-dependent receptor [Pleomorphovibrio marinus]
MKKIPILFFFVFLLNTVSILGQGQQKGHFQLHGKVVAEDGEGLGAHIHIHELGKGAIADLDGNFAIPNLRQGTYHLHFTHMGFKSASTTVIIKDEGEEIEVVMQPSSITLQELTIEANPFKNGPVEQSQTIDVVDRNYLEKNNTGTFANALEKLPGISTINTGVGISKPVIRGMSFNRIMVNDRGIKQEGQQWGADHGLEIDPFDVDRVEVIKGPASLIYGSDGMSGVINISPAGFPEEGTIRGHVISTYRTNNAMWGNTAMVEGSEKDFVFKGRFTAQDFQDYRVPTESFNYAGFVLPVYDNRLKNTAGRERHFSLTGGVRKNWGKSTLTVSQFNQHAGLFPGAVGIPRAYNLRHDGDHSSIDLPSQDNTHLKVISNTTIQYKQNWLELDLGFQRNTRFERSFPHAHGSAPTPEGDLALGLFLDTYTANLRYNAQINEKSQSIVGFQASLMDNNYAGFEFLLPQFTTLQGGAFYFHEYRWADNFIVNAGVRVDGARHSIMEHLQPLFERLEPTGEYDQRNPNIDRSFVNMSGSGGFSWILDNHHNLKLNLGSSYRIPTAIELSTNGIHHGNFRHEVGNPELNSERSYQADLNFSYSRKQFLFGISPFWGYYDGFIYLAPMGRFSTIPGASTMWEYRQHNAIFTGGEIKAEWVPFPNLHLNIAGEYVYNLNLETGLPLPLTPPLSILSGVEYKVPKIGGTLKNGYVYVEYRHAAAQNRVDRNERSTAGFDLLEAGIGWDLSLGSQLLKFQLSGQNLTNAFYFNHLSRYRLLNLPEQGRNVNLSLKIPFQIKN